MPGEFLPFLSVSLHAKVPGYVERILVDRGSRVENGQLLAELSAPEMAARIAEAESKVQAIESDRLQAEAQLAAAQSTYDRLKKAAETPGAIAGNELIQMEKQVEAAQALVRSRQQASRAAEAAVKTEKEMQSYLRITAPFDGVVTERLVHPGALVGPGADPVLLTIQQISQLRLVVAVPEEYVGGIVEGTKLAFQVPAYPERTYSGTLARVSHALDKGTRTMAVELDVVESRRFAGAGNVSERQVADPAIPPGAVRSEDQRRDDHRADVRRAKSEWTRRVGGRSKRRCRGRPDRGARRSEGGRHGRPARDGRVFFRKLFGAGRFASKASAFPAPGFTAPLFVGDRRDRLWSAALLRFASHGLAAIPLIIDISVKPCNNEDPVVAQ